MFPRGLNVMSERLEFLPRLRDFVHNLSNTRLSLPDYCYPNIYSHLLKVRNRIAQLERFLNRAEVPIQNFRGPELNNGRLFSLCRDTGKVLRAKQISVQPKASLICIDTKSSGAPF